MAQFLKAHVERALTQAALRVFAEQGFRAASMASIAREAGVSTGNVYRYFENKQVLFEHAVPPALGRRLLALLRARVRSGPEAFAEAADALLAFSIEHRLALVILLREPDSGLADKVVQLLEPLALAHFGVEAPSPGQAFALRHVYRNFVSVMTDALARHEDASALRAAVAAYTRYHLAGLTALLRGADHAEPSR